MRRLLPVLAISAALMLNACSLLPGNGIGSNWPAMPEATQFTPEQGVCHERASSNSAAGSYVPVPCSKAHMAETIFVGQLPAETAALKTSPQPESPDASPAWAACSKEVSNFFGRNWLDYRLRLYVYWPSTTGWKGGARWLRCDVVVPRDMANWDSDEVSQDGPFKKGAMDSLALGCFDLQETTSRDSLIASPCAVSHNTEYAGSVNLPKDTKYPTTDAEWDVIYDHCFGAIAEFVGVRIANLTTGAYAVPEETTWQGGGENAVRCYLWLDDRKMTGSAKGTRGVGIP